MALDFLPFALPDIGQEEIDEVVDTLRSNWITTGPKAAQFEKDFAEFIGCKHALAVNSCTAGLHLALDAVGVVGGDLVLTTPYTFTATAEVVRYMNADPVFIDVDPTSYAIDPDELERYAAESCETKQGQLVRKGDGRIVRAVMPVHIGGLPADMDRICAFAEAHGLKVVDDAAHALPSAYKGRMVGTMGDATAFSFYATKTITTGEGGMVTSDDDAMAARMRVMRLHGIDRDVWARYQSDKPKWYYEIVQPGYKYNLTDIQAGIGIQQLRKARTFLEKRRSIAVRYTEAFSPVRGLRTPAGLDDPGHAWHLYIVQIVSEKVSRDEFIEKMAEAKIGTSVHFIPLHIQPYYRDRYGLTPEDCPRAYEAFSKSVSLPIFTRMTGGDVQRVIDTVCAICQ